MTYDLKKFVYKIAIKIRNFENLKVNNNVCFKK